MTMTNGHSVTDSDMKAIVAWSADGAPEALHSLANRLSEIQADGLPSIIAISYCADFEGELLFHSFTAVVEQ